MGINVAFLIAGTVYAACSIASLALDYPGQALAYLGGAAGWFAAWAK